MAFQDTDPTLLVEAVAKELSKKQEFKAPEWAPFAKTGAHKERPPAREDWWTVRAAAILRTLATRGPIGVSKLRTKYGGRKRTGHDPSHFAKGSGSVARHALQQLDKAGFSKQDVRNGRKGRVATPRGIALLEQVAKQLSEKK